MTQPLWRAPARQETADGQDGPPLHLDRGLGEEPPWEVDLRSAPTGSRYPSRRELRDEHGSRGAGPTTQELAVHRDDRVPVPGAGGPGGVAPWQEEPGPADGRGERAKASVQRWSRWASGLGLPPQDGSGYRRYAGADRLLPPIVWIAAVAGVAGLVGLLAGLVINAPASGPPPQALVTQAPTTVTVTTQVTQDPVTRTTTRTTTTTMPPSTTQQAPAQEPAQQPAQAPPGGGLGPGSRGTSVARLQQALAALGFYQAAPTGSYDEATRAAVQSFQEQNAVAGDPPGVAGPATLAALARALGR